MAVSFYSPKKDGSGAMVAVSFNSKDESVWLKPIKQTGTTSHNGEFKGGASINVKLNVNEVGDILQAIRTNGGVSFFHKTPDKTTTITFKHYRIASKEEGKPDRVGFGLGIKQGSQEWKIGFTLGSAEALSEYLKFGLTHIFSANYAEDKKRAAEYANKTNKKPAPVENDVEEESPEQEAERDFDSDEL